MCGVLYLLLLFCVCVFERERESCWRVCSSECESIAASHVRHLRSQLLECRPLQAFDQVFRLLLALPVAAPYAEQQPPLVNMVEIDPTLRALYASQHSLFFFCSFES